MYYQNDFFEVNKNMIVLLSSLSDEEKKRCGLPESYTSIDYSHSLIKQMLMYFTLVDKTGESLIILSSLATEIGCTERTISKNNSIMKQAGIIQVEPRYTGVVLIKFNDFVGNVFPDNCEFENNYTDKDINEYIFISSARVNELVRLKNVNVLRTALRFQIMENEVLSNNREYVFLSYKEIKQFVPESIQSRKCLIEILKEVSKVFNVSVYDTIEKVESLRQSEEVIFPSVDKLVGLFMVLIQVKQQVPYKLHLRNIPKFYGNNESSHIILDEHFWDSTEYIQVYPEYLLMTKSDKTQAKYIDEEYFEYAVENNCYVTVRMTEYGPEEIGGFWTDEEWLQNAKCTMRDYNGATRKYLLTEARSRNKLKK